MRPQGILLDLDGTVWDDRLQPYQGAEAVISSLRGAGHTLRFVTNTTRLTRRSLAEMLTQRGIAASEDDIFTATLAGVVWLREKKLRRVAVLLPEAAKNEFDEFELVDDGPEALVVGDLGPGWSFEIMNRAFRWLLDGASLLALHRNRFWRTGGELVLDAGAFVAALEYSSGCTATTLGKPSPVLFEAAARSLGLETNDLVMVGDSMETDITGALGAGCRGVLVRTGKFDESDLRATQVGPTAIIDSIAELPSQLG